MFKEDEEVQNLEYLGPQVTSVLERGRQGSEGHKSDDESKMQGQIIPRTESWQGSQRGPNLDALQVVEAEQVAREDKQGASIGFQQQISQNYTVSIDDEIQEEIKVEVGSNDVSNQTESYFDL